MIAINVNIYGINQLTDKLDSIAENSKAISREVANKLLPIIKTRIHEQGLNSNEQQIGVYKNSYLKLRESKGRKSDSKVIFSLTGEMENDFGVHETTDGYGLGFNREINGLKAKGLQYGNKHLKGFGEVYAPTEKEKEQIVEIVTNYINDAIH
jgi:hypothetical protein